MNGKWKHWILAVMMVCVVWLAGCESDQTEFTKSGIEVSEDNTINAVIIENFTADYYQMEELKQFVAEDVANYNTELGSTAVTVGESSMENGTIRLNLSFQSFDAYNGYMPEEVFIGDLQGAYDRGYNFDRTLNTAGKDGQTIARADLMNMGNSKVIVVTGDLCVRCPSKILYYSTGMTLLDSQTVSADTAGNYFIIYK